VPAGRRATMDFFAAQSAARQRTAVLVGWFVLAWLGTIAVAWLATIAIVRLGSGTLAEVRFGAAVATGSFDAGRGSLALTPGVLGAVAAGVTLVIAGGSLFHVVRLARDGPHTVAAMVGGVPVDRATADPAQRRLVNVVEEMAIASGLPVPAIYVLPAETGINAFAAGFTPERAVLAVTRGAVDGLARDELQGVVAHELSHLLNGDARLALRLVALVGGITALALLGRSIARIDRGGRGLAGGRLAVFLLGACLWLAGSVGAFFGHLIRAAVSRQRELLADAAAVQFTRNPEGLARALAKIAEQGSVLSSVAAPELSHLFFANGLRSRWLATHPPIDERIRRLLPQGLPRARPARAAAARPPAPAGPLASAVGVPTAAQRLTATIGHPGPGHVAQAAELLARIPPEVSAAARSARTASALSRALLADTENAGREGQLGRLVDPAVRGEVARLAVELAGASREERMAILELALPALDGLSRVEASGLVSDLAVLARGGRASVFEWAVQRIVGRRVAPLLGQGRTGRIRARTVEEVQVEALELLTVLARLGARDEAGAQAALDAGAAALGVRGRWRLLPRDRVRADRLDAALARLDGATPRLKERLLEACAACALADGHLAPVEAEVVRAVAASLGCPVPPLASPASHAAGAA
jgi:Zn-dependent protease with chaperone function